MEELKTKHKRIKDARKKKYGYVKAKSDGKSTFYGYLRQKYEEEKNSEMERVIFYYSHARNTGNENDLKKADDQLDKIMRDFENGAYRGYSRYRLGIGIIYLLRNKFVEGNEDDILFEIDKIAFNDVFYRSKGSEINLYNLLHYLKMRTSKNPDKMNHCILLKNQQLLCMTLDAIGREKLNNTIDERLVTDMEDLCRSGFAKGLIQTILNSERYEKTRLKQIKENDITFVIPVRLDFPERKRNLLLLLEQLKQIPDASVIILEADKQPQFEYNENKYISYYFIEDHDLIFHRTKYINMLLSKVKTKIVGVWDTDVVVPCEQIIRAVRNIQTGYMMTFPYDGRFFTLSPKASEYHCGSRSISFLMENIEKFPQGFGTYSTGGAFIINKDEYLKIGGDNEHFYGWGVEDIERVKRVEILGYKILRVNGPLFHLYHPRTSWFDNINTEMVNRAEFVRICSMTRRELNDDIKTWKTSKM